MSDKRYTESKRYIVRGILALLGGSILLLAPQLLGLPEFLGGPLVFAGCAALLYGNYGIFYGLLIHAGNRPE